MNPLPRGDSTAGAKSCSRSQSKRSLTKNGVGSRSKRQQLFFRPRTMNMRFARWTGECVIFRPSWQRQPTAAVLNLLTGGSIFFERRTTLTLARIRARCPPTTRHERARRKSKALGTPHNFRVRVLGQAILDVIVIGSKFSSRRPARPCDCGRRQIITDERRGGRLGPLLLQKSVT
jgi:hypothetical protein